jgi:hypothetical protein
MIANNKIKFIIKQRCRMNATLRRILTAVTRTSRDRVQSRALCYATRRFNEQAVSFFGDLVDTFPSDANLSAMKQELETYMHNKSSVPALNFFQATYQNKLQGGNVTVANLIQDHDANLFAPAVDIGMPLLDMIQFKVKWAQLGLNQKDSAWIYLNNLTELSAVIVFLGSAEDELLLKAYDNAMAAAN